MTAKSFDWVVRPRTAYDASMSQYRCTQCGHLLSGDEVESHGRLHHPGDAEGDLLMSGQRSPEGDGPSPDLIVDLATEQPETSVTKGPERESTVNWATAALLLVVVAIVGWAVFGGGQSDAEAEAEEQDSAQGEDGLGTDHQATGDANLPPSDSHLAADNIAAGFQDLVDDTERFTVVYPTAGGLQMLSAAGSTTPDVSVAFGFEQMARFPLVSDGNRTWAVDPADPSTSYLVSTQFVVVDTALEGRVAFIDTSRDPIRVGISSFGAWGAGFDVPESSEILAVPGRGLLIMPITGGTFIVTATGVDPVSDDSAVAASANGTVYQRCDEALDCELYVTNPELPDGLLLDLRVGSEISVSPDGRFVASPDDEQTTTVFDIDGRNSWSFPANDVRGLGWAPDGSFLAVTTGTDLLVASTEDQSVVQLPLPADPTSGTVLVVSSPA